jgi:TolB-like protein
LSELQSRAGAALADRYRIERELGRGGTSIVYLAEDLRHGRLVAVKVLYPELAASLGPARFLREVEIAAGLTHPHILPLYDSGTAEGFLYYVMPYVEGESLRHRLRREIQLPVDEAVRIAREVAEALGHAHRHGIVHRDIKPENILLEGDHAVVADFGVARAIETAASERLTETGLAVGTAAYMSPEQAAGRGRVDGRSDIYSLGCVLFEMLAGEPPFSGGTAQAIVAKHLQAPVPDLRVVRATTSRELQRVVTRALAKVPADRYPSAHEFAGALETAAARVESLSWRRVARATGLAWALGAGILSVLPLLSRSPEGDEARTGGLTPRHPRIAVLYFDATTGDSALRRIAAGVTEELIYELSGVRAFQVISRNGVARYRDRRVPLDSMVAELGVKTVIDGSVQRWGDVLRVRLQLIDATSDTYLDSLSLERPLSDAVTFERALAQELAAGIRRQMGRQARLRDAATGAGNAEARALARKAQQAREDARELAESPHVEDLATAREALRRADSLLVLAESADSGWSDAQIERGWATAELARLLTGEERIVTLRSGLEIAEEAVRHQQSPRALELRGTLRTRLVIEVQAAPDEPDLMLRAEADLRAALDRDSTLARAWVTLGDLLWTKGSTAEASLAARRALREDTYLADVLTIYNDLFFTDLMLGNFPQAGEWCRRGRLTFPNHWRFLECELTLMRHHATAPQLPDSAWRLVRSLDSLDPAARARSEGRDYHSIYRRIVAATISARAGRHDVARAELAKARRQVRSDRILSMDLNYDEAYLRLVLGDRQRATALLEAYIRARPFSKDYLARDPLLRGLRVEP